MVLSLQGVIYTIAQTYKKKDKVQKTIVLLTIFFELNESRFLRFYFLYNIFNFVNG